MRTPKKVWEGIIIKIKGNPTTSKKTATKEPKDSHTLVDIEIADIEKVMEESLEVKEQEDIPHTETDTQLREDSKDFQPIFESSEEDQKVLTEQGPNVPDNPSPTEPCFDSDVTDKREKPLTTQAIIAGTVGAMLLAGSVAFYALKIHITVAVVAGIVGLVCIGCALYNTLKPNTKLEKVEKIEQLDLPSPSL